MTDNKKNNRNYYELKKLHVKLLTYGFCPDSPSRKTLRTTQHKWQRNASQHSNALLCDIALCVVFCYVEHHCAKCHYAECHYAFVEINRRALIYFTQSLMLKFTNRFIPLSQTFRSFRQFCNFIICF